VVRLLLTVTFEALQDAFLPTERLRGSKTGVFIGISHSDYGELLARQKGTLCMFSALLFFFSHESCWFQCESPPIKELGRPPESLLAAFPILLA